MRSTPRSTHDTKWSEDVRARINVLSEIPNRWKLRLNRWSRLNQAHKAEVDGRLVPSPNEEVLLYQALLGVWPLDEPDFPRIKERMGAFLLKAVREAKTHSNWFSPNEPYEAALHQFLGKILEPEQNEFLDDFSTFLQEISFYGACNAYAQVLLKMTAPGVPDFYQGNGLWQFRLTDPDNRNSVDYRHVSKIMEGLFALEADPGQCAVCDLLKNWRDGRLKLYLTKNMLRYRRAHKELFSKGDYLPLRLTGSKKEHACSFARCFEGAWAIAMVPRLTTKLVKPGVFPLGEAVWDESTLVLPPDAPDDWVDVFTGQRVSATRRAVPVGRIFSKLPFALLVHEPSA